MFIRRIDGHGSKKKEKKIVSSVAWNSQPTKEELYSKKSTIHYRSEKKENNGGGELGVRYSIGGILHDQKAGSSLRRSRVNGWH